MERIICLCIGYVCGLLQTGYLVGKINHIDIRKEGSGNAGSTNALRVMGWKAGLLTFAGDVVKCVAAIFIVRYILQGERVSSALSDVCRGWGPPWATIFHFICSFKGGKGIAVLAGLVVSTDPLLDVPIPLAAFLIAAVFTRYVSLGSLLASITVFSRDATIRAPGVNSRMVPPYTI